MKSKFPQFVLLAAMLMILGPLALTQETARAHIELTHNGRRAKDASQVVVWLTPTSGIAEALHQDPHNIPKLVQKDKAFHPSLIVIPVGGKVEFPNHDPFFHNVFSLFEGKRFDLGLYESGTTRFVQFDRPGISFIFCNIHAEMSAVVIALATPYWAISDRKGDVSIPNVPAGRYEMQVFHSAASPEVLHALTREVTVGPANTFLGSVTVSESDVMVAHKNKYGRDYDPPQPDSPAYARP